MRHHTLQKPKIGRIGQLVGHTHQDVNITVEMYRHKRHARDMPLVKSCGVWALDWHVWIYVSPRRWLYLLTFPSLLHDCIKSRLGDGVTRIVSF